MMMRISYLIIFLLFVKTISAQHTMGKVLGTNDNGTKEALPGANIYWQGTTIGTSTDSLGMFQILNPENVPANLIVSMIGFASDTITLKEQNRMDIQIVLKNTVNLKEVNVETRQNTTLYSTFNPINTEVISGKELLKAACCNLSESFSTNASIDVAFTDAVSGAKKIQMLGLDGVKGTGSVVNGYESISGQINLEFLKPQNEKKRFFINLYVNAKSRAEVNIHLAKKINTKWSTMLFTHVSDLSKKNDMNHDLFLDMPLTRQYNVFNRWDYHNQKNFEAQFGVKALVETRQGGQAKFNYKNDIGTNGAHGQMPSTAAHLPTTPYGIGINTKVMEYFSKTGFMFPSTPYKSIGIQTSGKWQQQDMYFGHRRYYGEQRNFYLNAIYANIINNTNHKYKLGLSYLLDDYTERYIDSISNSFFVRTESVPGVFAEYTYTHTDNFSIVAGARADYHNLFGMQYTPRLHMRYNATKSTTLRLSGGKGFRTSNIFVENQSVFASSRQLVIQEKLRPEVAWNYGISANQKFKLFYNEAFVNVDFFRTDFQNQVIVDLDQHVNKIVFYNLDGQSYSHSLQVDFGFTPIKMFDIKMAYKWYDVKTTYNHVLLDKPYVPKHRIMLNMAYSTYMDIWKFDFTANWLGQSRIPNTLLSPVQYQLPTRSKEYYLMNAQITKKFRKFEVYLGCENILNYMQKNPIIAFDNPYGNNFDASMIYAPVDGRIIYAGFRMSIK
ncbi:MAG: TonB-dependent receptor [Bacteroidetes bacterium]|nr:TonB-dependent receptor [Bacteroidota bacterium]